MELAQTKTRFPIGLCQLFERATQLFSHISALCPQHCKSFSSNIYIIRIFFKGLTESGSVLLKNVSHFSSGRLAYNL